MGFGSKLKKAVKKVAKRVKHVSNPINVAKRIEKSVVRVGKGAEAFTKGTIQQHKNMFTNPEAYFKDTLKSSGNSTFGNLKKAYKATVSKDVYKGGKAVVNVVAPIVAGIYGGPAAAAAVQAYIAKRQGASWKDAIKSGVIGGVSSIVGGGVGGGVAGGAASGATSATLQGGNKKDILLGSAVGGVAGGASSLAQGLSAKTPITSTTSGTPASAMHPALAQGLAGALVGGTANLAAGGSSDTALEGALVGGGAGAAGGYLGNYASGLTTDKNLSAAIGQSTNAVASGFAGQTLAQALANPQSSNIQGTGGQPALASMSPINYGNYNYYNQGQNMANLPSGTTVKITDPNDPNYIPPDFEGALNNVAAPPTGPSSVLYSGAGGEGIPEIDKFGNLTFKQVAGSQKNPYDVSNAAKMAYEQSQDQLQLAAQNQYAVNQARQGTLQQLGQIATGKGPSLAQAQLKAAQDRNLAQQLAAISSARGGGTAANLRTAALTASNAGRQTAQDSAVARLQEAQQAREQLFREKVSADTQTQEGIGQTFEYGVAPGRELQKKDAASIQREQIASGERSAKKQAQSQLTGALISGLGSVAASYFGRPAAPATTPGTVNKYKGGYVHGGQVKAKGDSPANDTIPAMLSPGEIVIPRSKAQDAEKAKSFIDALAEKGTISKKSKNEIEGYGAILSAQADLDKRLSELEQKRSKKKDK